MNQRLWIATLTAASLTACGTLERRFSPPLATPSPAQETEKPSPSLEQELKGDLPADATSSTETPADAVLPSSVPTTTAPTSTAAMGSSDELSIVLKDKNGKVVKGTAPSTIGGPAPSMPTTGSSLAKADAVALPPPTPQASEAAAEPTEPLVTDTDFEITKASQRVPGKIKGDQALLWLKNGNKRFTKGFLRKDGQSKKDIKRLIAGEQPHSVILSCSDSRTPPEVLFDQKLGEIYVVRTAGPSLDSAVIASLEDAVERLGVNLLVVMGHSACESVKTALHAHPVKSPHLAQSIAAMSLRLKAFSRRPASTELKEEAWTNVSGVTQELLQKSVLIRTAVESGTLKIQEALYNMNQGSVDFKDH